MTSLRIPPTVLLLFLALAVGGCKYIRKPVKPPTIMMDDWLNVDHAKNRCRQRAYFKPCTGDPKTDVQDFELEVASAFTGDSTCHGFRLIGVMSPVKDEDSSTSEWDLMLNFDPGETQQSWSLISKHSVPVITAGEGGAKEIAHAICAVLAQKGGTVE